MREAILALNAGSSSIKFALFELGSAGVLDLLLRGTMEDRGAQRSLSVTDADGNAVDTRRFPPDASKHDLLAAALAFFAQHLEGHALVAAGHRVVHGGRDFVAPCLIDDATFAALERLTPLAPLHQPRSLEPVRVVAEVAPGLPQVACFDTAFHSTLTPPVSRYGLPRDFEARGIRKFGFHGLAYEHIARRLGEIDPDAARKRTIVAHLGSGASLCAIRDGRSLDTTMGFSALDGLLMGTRCGALDPGILLYLLKTEGRTVEEIEDLLYRRSGLLGVSGISSDLRDLLASDDARAREAFDLFVFMIARQVAALTATLEGLDALVFTGGIGEHAPQVRQAVCDRLSWLGVDIASDHADAVHAGLISTNRSAVEVRVIPADEERSIGRHIAALIHPSRAPTSSF